jgi:hypothetical protein
MSDFDELCCIELIFLGLSAAVYRCYEMYAHMLSIIGPKPIMFAVNEHWR